MAFPTSPTNGQTYTVNGIVYTYNSTKTAWTIQSTGSATVPTAVGANLAVGGNLTVSGTASVTGNANVGNIGTATAVITTAANVPVIQNGNSNVAIAANGAVSLASNGAARLTVQANGQVDASSVLTASGNIANTLGGFVLVHHANRTPAIAGKSSVQFIPTGANQTWTVPGGVTYIYVKMWGAGGSGGSSGGWAEGSRGGGGGHSCGLIPVTPGESLIIVVGLAGQCNYSGGQTPRYGGGGGFFNNSDNRYCGSGGGYAGIFRTSVSQANAVMIAGGGGGGGCSRFEDGNWGGAGGGDTGQQGNSPYDGRASTGGGAGTQSAGGAAGISQNTIGSAGSALTGGYGAFNAYGGGGGGGYFGGGGGGYYESNSMSGGGGGSGYIGPTVLFGGTYTGSQHIPACADDPDLPKTVETYNGWNKYGWGGDIVISTSQYTSTGGGGGYVKIFY